MSDDLGSTVAVEEGVAMQLWNYAGRGSLTSLLPSTDHWLGRKPGLLLSAPSDRSYDCSLTMTNYGRNGFSPRCCGVFMLFVITIALVGVAIAIVVAGDVLSR